jgi:glutaconate CoA-transferase subunit B
VMVVAPHSKRTFVEQLDFLTTRAAPEAVITDLGVLEPDAAGELTLTQIHPGVTVEQVREATGWELQVAGDLRTTPEPTEAELSALRELVSR